MPDQVSRALGSRYELTQRLGQGAMGEVWLAQDRQNKRTVAAKLLHRQFTQDTSIVGRFVQERSILIELRHPNIVEVIDLVVEGDDLAIVMEYVEGGSLGGYSKQNGTLPVQMAVSATCGVLEAVAFAHSKGVLHRDIKPDNVLLATKDAPSEKTVRLSDFGIARLAQEESVRATGLLGTPAYMPPEMFESGIFSQASDVYAVGVMLYELLAGRTPFEGGASPMAVGMRHVSSLPPKLPIDERLWRIVDTMLAKDPALRLTAKDTLAALRELAPQLDDQQLPVQPQPESWQNADHQGQLGTTLHVQAMDGDVGATYVPGNVSKASPAPVAGDVKAVITTGAGDRDGMTMMAVNSSPNRTLDPTLESQAPELIKKKRPWWLIISGSVVGVLVIAVGIFFFTRNVPTSLTQTIDYTPGYAVGTQLPSGLRIDYDAKAGQEANTVSLGITFTTAKDTGLTGDVLQVFPQENDQCPTLESTQWKATVSPILKSKDGLDAPCGYRIPVDLVANDNQKLQLTLSGVGQADLNTWISSIQSETSSVLRLVTGSDFAIQRIQSISVQASDVRLAGDTPSVPYTVSPVWDNGSADQPPPDPIFTDTTLDYQATDVLLTLTGGQGFDRVTVTSCTGTQVIGHRVVAEQSNDNCEVDVRVGALDAQSRFSIRMAPS